MRICHFIFLFLFVKVIFSQNIYVKNDSNIKLNASVKYWKSKNLILFSTSCEIFNNSLDTLYIPFTKYYYWYVNMDSTEIITKVQIPETSSLVDYSTCYLFNQDTSSTEYICWGRRHQPQKSIPDKSIFFIKIYPYKSFYLTFQESCSSSYFFYREKGISNLIKKRTSLGILYIFRNKNDAYKMLYSYWSEYLDQSYNNGKLIKAKFYFNFYKKRLVSGGTEIKSLDVAR